MRNKLARRFVSSFMIKTDTTFNTNQLNLSLSVLVGVTNTGKTFPAAYCYIISKSAKYFAFLFKCIKDLIFHNACLSPKVILEDFAVGLTATLHRQKAPDAPDATMNIAWQVAQSLHEKKLDCILQLCT